MMRLHTNKPHTSVILRCLVQLVRGMTRPHMNLLITTPHVVVPTVFPVSKTKEDAYLESGEGGGSWVKNDTDKDPTDTST